MIRFCKHIMYPWMLMRGVLGGAGRVVVLTKCCLVQKVEFCVEGLELGVFVLDDADDEVQQRLFTVCRFGV